GKIVCPDFVDAHSHSDRSIHSNPTAESTIRQGITTEIVGNCGSSYAPAVGPARDTVVVGLKRMAYDGPVTWTSFGEYLDALDTMGISPNLACYVGHHTLHRAPGVSRPKVTADHARPHQR